MAKRTILFLTLAIAILISCNSKSDKAKQEQTDGSLLIVKKEKAPNSNDTDRSSKNSIRFKDWNKHDWIDNEYVRTLRKYIDAYNSGKIDDPDLDPYKKNIKGKFVIYRIEPYIAGGLYIEFIFIDSPELLFTTNVYSEVDEEKEIVTDYECCLRLKKAEAA